MYKSKEKLDDIGTAKSAIDHYTGRESGIYGSNNDLSLSSNSKAHQTQKRQWKASEKDKSPVVDDFTA